MTATTTKTLTQELIQDIVQDENYVETVTWNNSPYLDWKRKDPTTKGTIGERIVSKVIGVDIEGPFKKGHKDLKNGEEVKVMFLTKQGKFCINRLKADTEVIYLVIVQPSSVMIRKTHYDTLCAGISLDQQGFGNNDKFKLNISLDELLAISTEVAKC